jgi:hypothetical protein
MGIRSLINPDRRRRLKPGSADIIERLWTYMYFTDPDNYLFYGPSSYVFQGFAC